MSTRGISVRLFAACSANGDAFVQFLCSSPDEQLSKFCTPSLSPDSVELALAEMNASIGYKATAAQFSSCTRHPCLFQEPNVDFHSSGISQKALSFAN